MRSQLRHPALTTANNPGNVDELDLRFDFLRRLGDFGDPVEAGFGHRDAADVRLDRAEGIIGRLRRRRS